jgi:hypothetical protein
MLACHTQEEISEVVGIARIEVKRLVGDFLVKMDTSPI